MSRVEPALGCWWFVGCGTVKLHEEGGLPGSRDSPQENHDLRSDLLTVFNCATGIMIPSRPLTSRDSSEPDCSPTKTEPPLLCHPFAGTISPGFRAVRASPAERALRSPRSPPSGRSGAALAFSRPLARRRLSRAISRSVLQDSIPVWSDMLCGRFIFFFHSNVARAVNSTRSSCRQRVGGGDATWPRGGRGQQTPRCVPNATRALQRTPRRSHAISPPTDTARCSIFHS